MGKYLSNKLKVISFVSMVLVVFRHAYNLSDQIDLAKEHKLSFMIQVFMSSGVTSIAVPIFFTISGYLLFQKKIFIQEYIPLLKRRFHSLVIPYLFWTTCWMIFSLVKNIVLSHQCQDCTIGSLLANIFIAPIPLQFWFIRDLFILVLFYPIIYFLIQYSKGVVLVPLFIIWFLNIGIPLNESIAILFFSIGCFLSLNKFPPIVNKRYSLCLCLMWLVILLIQTYIIYHSNNNSSILSLIQGDSLSNLFDKLGIIIGILALWSLYDQLFSEDDVSHSRWFTYTNFSFFIYAFHVPLLWMIPKWIYSKIGLYHNSLVIYIIAPSLLIVFSIILAIILKRIMPKMYAIITGGR